MNCLKCGAEIPDGKSFCEKCLEGMKAYPVPEDVSVNIQRRSDAGRRSKKQTLSAEEKLVLVNGKLKRTRRLCALLLVLCLALAGLFVWKILQDQKPVVGQNYSTVASTASTTGSLPTEG